MIVRNENIQSMLTGPPPSTLFCEPYAWSEARFDLLDRANNFKECLTSEYKPTFV